MCVFISFKCFSFLVLLLSEGTVATWLGLYGSYQSNPCTFLKNKAPKSRRAFGSLHLCSQTLCQKIVKAEDAHFMGL
jgi:hypothetical protein